MEHKANEPLPGQQQRGSLIEDLLIEQARVRQRQLVQHWEKQCTLDEHVHMLASALLDLSEMQAVDDRHKLTSEKERRVRELSKGLIARLGGDRERLQTIVRQAVEQEQARRDLEPADIPRAAHLVLPKSYTAKHAGVTYTLAPKFEQHFGFWGQYEVIVDGQVVGIMDYDSATESWKVPNHTRKKVLKKAWADFLDWHKNPRRHWKSYSKGTDSARKQEE